MASESACPDTSLPPPLILRRLLDISCFYARTAADERDGARALLQQLQHDMHGMMDNRSALAGTREKLAASEALVQRLQAAVADVTNASALESRVLLQKIAQLTEGQEQGSEQQLQARPSGISHVLWRVTDAAHTGCLR